MLKRILTSAVGLVIFFAVLASSSTVFAAAILLVTACMLYELHKAMDAHPALFVLGFLSCALYTYGIFSTKFLPAAVTAMVLYLIATVALFNKVHFRDIYASAFVTLFISAFMIMISMIRIQFGAEFVLLVFICAWMTDSGAYFAGRFLGRHKLAPNLSPKKTIEGSIGGSMICVVSCVVYLLILHQFMGYQVQVNSYLQIALVGLLASVFGQLGDLIASAIKRDCGVKDFGSILPGHGGVLDRFDSVVFIAPFIYYILFRMNIL